MKLKLLKGYKVAAVPATETTAEIPEQIFPIDAVIEVEDQAACDALIADGTAIAYSPEMEEQDKQAEEQARIDAIKQEAERLKMEQKSISATQKTVATGAKKMDMVTKKITDLSTKAVTGAQTLTPVESGTVITKMIDSPIINSVKQAQTEALTYNVLFDGSNGSDDTDTVGYTDEVTEKEVTAPLKATKVNLGKVFGTVLVSNGLELVLDGVTLGLQFWGCI